MVPCSPLLNRASDSFRTLLFDEQWFESFRNAMRNNIVFFGIHTLVQNPVALLLAALLSLRGVRGAAAYRTVMFLPTPGP